MNSIAKAQKVLSVLISMQDTLKDTNTRRKVLDVGDGLCGNFYSAYSKVHQESVNEDDVFWFWLDGRDNAYHSWPKYTGSNGFPVPHKKFSNPGKAYWGTNSKYVGQYGKDRLELLDHLVEHFRKLATVSLENLAEATEQQVFDQVATHLLTQNQKSQKQGVGGKCLYRYEDLKCAAGCLIADDDYAKKLDAEKQSQWGSLYDAGLVPEAHVSLIAELQYVHDSMDVCTWKAGLTEVAEKFDLKTNF